MPIKKAKTAFVEEKLSCGQSVLRGFQEHYNIDEKQIIDAKKFGGGRADGGFCGALYAAWILASDERIKEQIRERFAEQAGSDKCREIRQLGRLSCGDCVELAATLLYEKADDPTEKV